MPNYHASPLTCSLITFIITSKYYNLPKPPIEMLVGALDSVPPHKYVRSICIIGGINPPFYPHTSIFYRKFITYKYIK